MRCSKRLPLILSVLALPLVIFAGTAEAKNKKAQDVEAIEPELWQLRAYGHNHLQEAQREMNMQLRAAKKAKKAPKKSSSKKLKIAHEKGHNLVQSSIPEEDKFADYESSFQPELWQLRAHGHHFLLKNAYEKHQQMLKKGKAQQAKMGKKQAAVKGKKLVAKKRDLNEKKQQRILAAEADADDEPAIAPLADGEEDEEVDIAHHRRKHRHHNHEDDEHDKYDPDNELTDDDGGDKKGGGKGADKAKGKDKDGKNGGAPKKGIDGKAPNDPLDGTTPKDGAKPPKGGAKAPVDGKTPPAGAAPIDGIDPSQPPAAKPGNPSKPANKPAPIVPIQRMGDFVTKCNTPGQIALTYSEGPSEATTQMLEILKEAKARVTFFANATWLEYMQYAGVTRRAYNDGHLIGMTYRLPNDSSMSMTDAQLKADIAKQANKIYELIGKYPKYVRLHDAGLKDPKLEPTIRAMGYTLVGFNLDETDYKYNTREKAPQIADVYEQTFVKQADAFGRKGSYVVVGYDIPASGAAAALPDVISSIIRNEYDMVRLDGCNNDNKPYKKSPMVNDGFVADDFSFGGTKYVHGQSPVAVQNGKAVPGQMPSKIGGTKTANTSGSSSVVPSLFGMVLAVLVALTL
ncbi:hypothetical protein BGZ72_008649 [Mortierella alpina]|nr:hypothetical protein BGZ72_008649 [Mortierella alpina]